MHLQAEELVDIAEGVRPESAAPHLAACARCRAQLDDVRAMMSAVAEADAPEPSPLFWDHFSRRVHDAVAAEPEAARVNSVRALVAPLLGAPAFRVSVAAFAALALVVFAASRVKAPAPRPAMDASVAQPVGSADWFGAAAADNDASFSLVATLASNLEADTPGAIVSDAGLAYIGSADHAVTHMDGGELRELHRILQEEMTP
jgi:hypothetical protein